MYIHGDTQDIAKKNQPNKALFLDRDGVLIEYFAYLSQPHQIKIPFNAREIFKAWQDAGYLLIVITNQSGIARGYFTANDVEAVHGRIRQEYGSFGVHFQDIFVCPHQPSDNCKCRKPSPEMLLKAAKKHYIELSRSFFIGDAISDIQCAVNAGCKPILLLTDRTLALLETLAHTQASIHIVNELAETLKLI